ncbi:DUF3566 domain-containing protein [Bifidobacterium choloepi]|uniref:DUF3566 domain-containing protein n=1 Tax=Bifidobacterium choloepi TaxID=2614131 RepID=A0A6I5N2V2_9BIFI|nr:DUF3566 domain-containing protein [Bifidobacterium choloepi]NEG69989.1 DUF3566 domain-containing protein [Bifidobacterium choloepi]
MSDNSQGNTLGSSTPQDADPSATQVFGGAGDGADQESGQAAGRQARGHGKNAGASPRVARSASNQPLIADKDRPDENRPVRPVRRKKDKKPRARRMNLSLTRVDAWSVAKVAFMLSLAGAIIQIVAVTLLWSLLKVVGVFDQVNQIFSSAGLDSSGIDLTNILSLPTILSAVSIFSIVEIILLTLLATIFALLYNVIGLLVGGVHVTLGDD